MKVRSKRMFERLEPNCSKRREDRIEGLVRLLRAREREAGRPVELPPQIAGPNDHGGADQAH